ncbi:hypothetical protein L7F22_005283 [Adiantum nelumboides]|nr:hypothetical protein [Adiantum nelumboides]
MLGRGARAVLADAMNCVSAGAVSLRCLRVEEELSSTGSLSLPLSAILSLNKEKKRDPLPPEEIQKRVEAIVFRYRKKPKPKDDIDWHFKEVGNYHVKDEEIQKLYKEYLRLYHPELAGDELPASEKGQDSSETKKGSDHVDNDTIKNKHSLDLWAYFFEVFLVIQGNAGNKAVHIVAATTSAPVRAAQIDVVTPSHYNAAKDLVNNNSAVECLSLDAKDDFPAAPHSESVHLLRIAKADEVIATF